MNLGSVASGHSLNQMLRCLQASYASLREEPCQVSILTPPPPPPLIDLESSSHSGTATALSHPFLLILSSRHKGGYIFKKESSEGQERVKATSKNKERFFFFPKLHEDLNR